MGNKLDDKNPLNAELSQQQSSQNADIAQTIQWCGFNKIEKVRCKRRVLPQFEASQNKTTGLLDFDQSEATEE